MVNRVNIKLPFLLTWLFLFLLAVLISFGSELDTSSFYGIADTKELVINQESSIEIKQIFVVEGQLFKKGDLLAELRNTELNLKLTQLQLQIKSLASEKTTTLSKIRSRIKQLESKKFIYETENLHLIEDIKNKIQLNRQLAGDLKSLETDTQLDNEQINPITSKINSLREDLKAKLEDVDIEKKGVNEELLEAKVPYDTALEKLYAELEMVKSASDNLNIYATQDGIVGTIYAKPGEKLSPFSSILTYNSRTPSFIKGCILEKSFTRAQIGKNIIAQSLADPEKVINGKIVGVGSRIVPYPERLKKHPEIQLWGREVLIKIPEENSFILGEKVLLNLEDTRSFSLQVWENLKNLFEKKFGFFLKKSHKVKINRLT